MTMNNFEQFEKRNDERWERELDEKIDTLLEQYYNFQREEGETKLEYLTRKKKLVSKIIDTYIVIKVEGFGFEEKGYRKDYNIKQYEFAELSYLVEEAKRKQKERREKVQRDIKFESLKDYKGEER